MALRIAAVAVTTAIALTGVRAPAVRAVPTRDGGQTTLATTASNGVIAVYRGWIVWSAPGAGGWHLTGWHNGTIAELPVAPRPQPFDVDLGTDASGHVVATYSRCRHTPSLGFFGYLDASTGSECRVRELFLATGRELGVAIPHPRGTSDTTPSMWHGRVAFARRDPAHHKDVAQTLLWSPSASLRTLPHGGVPMRCPYSEGCKGATYLGEAAGIDLGSRVLTYLWLVAAPDVVGHGGFEVRADRLSDGRTVLAGAGYVGEACTEGEDALVPSLPAADGSHVWYFLRSESCYHNRYSVVRFNARTRQGLTGRLSVGGELLQLPKYGSAFYGLIAPPPMFEEEPRCDASGAPCRIDRLTRPALDRKLRRPERPYGF